MSYRINQNTDKLQYRVWAWSCPHLNADVTQGSQNNVEIAINQLQSENLTFDLSFCAGDYDSQQTPPTLSNSSEGEDFVSALDNLTDLGLTHNLLDRVAGNHDAGDGNMDWYLRYIDPLGNNTSYSNVNPKTDVVTMGVDTWHSYYRVMGKFLILYVSDRNDLPYPYGRGGSVENGGHPSGTITLETWNWMQNVILNNSDKNIIIVTHQNPRNTTIGTGDGDGSIGIEDGSNLHGESGITAGSGSLYSIYDENTMTADSPTTAFLDFFEDNPNHTVVLWCAGHSHGYMGEVLNGKGGNVEINGVNFLNLEHLTRYHIGTGRKPTHSMSKILEFYKKKILVRHYNHQDIVSNPAGDDATQGFYESLNFEINLKV